jgi:TAT (twin-arginine translocation) pathway signal sequence
VEHPNRRTFLAVSGAGVAAAGLASLPLQLAQAAEPPLDPKSIGDDLLLACVDDLATGQITVVHGGSELTITDHDLARKIARLSKTSEVQA